MAEEVKTTEVQNTTATTESAPRAPREDFNAMSIEELRKIAEEPLERVTQPNEKAMNDKCAEIDKEINSCFARFEELKIERQMIQEGFKLERAAREEDMAARKALFDARKELSAKLGTARSELTAVSSELSQVREQLSNIPSVNVNELADRIDEAENRIEVESLSQKEERELNRKIQGWRDQLMAAKGREPVIARRKELEEKRKAMQADLDKIRSELNEVYKKLGAKKEKAEEEKEKEEEKKEEKKEKEDPFKKVNDEWKEVSDKIDAKRKEKKEVIDTFHKQRRLYNEYSFANRRQRAARAVMERKEAEAAEAEALKKEEEEMLKRHPFEKEMKVCDDLIAYLNSLVTKESKTSGKAAQTFEVPEGMTLLKKEEEVYYAEEPKKQKRNRKDRKARQQKKAGFTHELDTLQSFALIRVAAPVTEEEVKTALETVTARKTFFDGLPRGADVDAELAKL